MDFDRSILVDEKNRGRCPRTDLPIPNIALSFSKESMKNDYSTVSTKLL